jgi:hypothetical protein
MPKLHLVAPFLLAAISVCAVAAEKYTGPVPPKADIPYLVHADNLIPLDVSEARDETRKDAQVASVPGAAASARTPLSEPIFIMKTDKLSAERMQAYRMEVRNGNREVVVSQKKGKGIGRPIYMNVTRLGDNLYKLEIDQPLDNGQYTLSPDGSNQAFSFEIY